MNAEGIDDSQRHGLIGGLGEGAVNDVFQHRALFQHTAHIRVRLQRGVCLDAFPVAVIGNNPRLIGHLLIDDAADGFGDSFKHFAFFNSDDSLKGSDVCGMNWKELHIFLQLLRHFIIQLAERLQMKTDHGLLFRRFCQHTVLGHVGDILTADEHLLITVLHFQQGIGYMMEDRILKQCFLDAADKT